MNESNGQQNNWIISILSLILRVNTWKELLILILLAWTGVAVWDITLNSSINTKSVIGCLDRHLPQASLVEVYSFFEKNDINSYSIYTIDGTISQPIFSIGNREYNSFFIVSDRTGTVAVVVFYDPTKANDN